MIRIRVVFATISPRRVGRSPRARAPDDGRVESRAWTDARSVDGKKRSRSLGSRKNGGGAVDPTKRANNSQNAAVGRLISEMGADIPRRCAKSLVKSKASVPPLLTCEFVCKFLEPCWSARAGDNRRDRGVVIVALIARLTRPVVVDQSDRRKGRKAGRPKKAKHRFLLVGSEWMAESERVRECDESGFVGIDDCPSSSIPNPHILWSRKRPRARHRRQGRGQFAEASPV